MENMPSVHIDLTYRGKKVKAHLSFSDEKSDKSTEAFYNSLKQIYMEKAESRALNPDISALK